MEMLAKLIQQLEISLLEQSVRQSATQLNSLIADDFTEFGSSGEIYNKRNILESLPTEEIRNFVVSDFEVKELSKDVMLATYKTAEAGLTFLRSSIWKRYDDDWRMVFHQGTKMLSFEHESVEIIPNSPYRMYYNVKDAFNIIDQKVVEYDKKCVPATQNPDIIDLNYIIKDNEEIIAGICADVYIWKILFISLIFVHDDYRHKKLGSLLIQKVEEKAKSLGATLAHLDTFSFQAKDFYIKHGYEIFGVLDDCPPGYKRYYLRKDLYAR
jgi:GNAT superfamily N-acetyltransferase